MAMTMAGMVLSQPEMPTKASSRWPRTTSSTESAMTSRLTSEAFMPSVPMAIPSVTVMLLNSMGVPPAARIPSLTFSASARWFALQGVISIQQWATPTSGRARSASLKPTALKYDRAAARSAPSTSRRLWARGSVFTGVSPRRLSGLGFDGGGRGHGLDHATEPLGQDAAHVEQDLVARVGIAAGQLFQELPPQDQQPAGAQRAHGGRALAGLAEERDLAEEVALLEQREAAPAALHLAGALQDHVHLALADALARDELPRLRVEQVARGGQPLEGGRGKRVDQRGRALLGPQPLLEGRPDALAVELDRHRLLEQVGQRGEVERRPLAGTEVLLDQRGHDGARALEVLVVGEHDHERDAGAVAE